MTNTITKTAVAAFAAAFAMTGAAFAEDTLNDKVNAQMKASQAQIAETVNASAQERVANLAAKQDKADEDNRAERYTVASK